MARCDQAGTRFAMFVLVFFLPVMVSMSFQLQRIAVRIALKRSLMLGLFFFTKQMYSIITVIFGA